MNSESGDKEKKEIGKKIVEESPERLDEMMKESERVGLLHKLEKAAERVKKRGHETLITTLEKVRDNLERRARERQEAREQKEEKRGFGVVDRRTGVVEGVPPGEAQVETSSTPSTPENVYLTRWDLLSDKSRVVALFYLDQFRWRYQYILITRYFPGARYWKKKKKKKKESDYTELFMVDDLFGDKDVDLSKVIGDML